MVVKFIDEDYSKRIKEWIRMTKVARLFEEEKIEAVNETKIRTKIETKKEIAQNMLKMGIDILDIMKATGLKKVEVEALKRESIDA